MGKSIVKSSIIIIIAFSIMFGFIEFDSYFITKNVSISEPIGYYLKLPVYNPPNQLTNPISNNIKHGERYLICLNDKKYILILKQLHLPNVNNQCPYQSPYLLKTIAGVPTDTIEITKSTSKT